MKTNSTRGFVWAAALTALSLIVLPGVARGDWNPGDPHKMHYPQLPDLTPTGLDVLATRQPSNPQIFKLLADDWRCSQTGPVDDIHIWGSWLNNILPQQNPANVTFKLSIHADIPAPPTGGFSQPGAELWSRIFPTGTFLPRLYGTGPENFYDPNLHQIIGSDSQIWQYNFENIPNPFVQQFGTIYWLDVQALPGTPDAFFGWKTTNPLDPRTPHFMDDAVFGDTAGFATPLLVPPGWSPLVYPPGHPLAGLSMDLAFVITPEPGALGLLVIGALGLLRRRD